MVDFVISLVLVPTLLVAGEAGDGRAPHERYLVLAPLQRVARFSCAHPGACSRSSLARRRSLAALGILRLRVDTNHINFFSADASAQPVGGGHRQASSAGVYSFQILLEGPPESLKTPDALQRDGPARGRAAEVAVRAQGDVGRRLREADQQGAQRRPAGGGRRAGRRRTIAQELFVFALGGEGRHELERVVASDFSRAQITVKLAVDELGPRARADRGGRPAGEGGVRRHRHHAC